ncbi:MAG: transcription termination/antitermination protein NusG [Candidatus Electrothrix sp. EH2]|nr:transcription termination/antitermination protein NusG [Candidatus Electrothrix sp. EH2]
MAKKWYIVHTHTGFEVKVKATLEDNIRQAGQEEFFGDILVPTEQVVEMVKGERKTSERKFFPGYLLVQMDMNQHSWHTVMETQRVTGFVGVNAGQGTAAGGEVYKQIPSLTEKEANKIITRIEKGAEAPIPKVVFEVGDIVRVTEGPFANFEGTVDEVFPDKGRVRVMVSIFGRSTPVELEYMQVSNN